MQRLYWNIRTKKYEPPIEIMASDYVSRSHPERADELANVVTVTYHKFKASVGGKPEEVEGWPKKHTVISPKSIDKNGVARFEYPDSNLIQCEELHAIPCPALARFGAQGCSEHTPTLVPTQICINLKGVICELMGDRSRA